MRLQMPSYENMKGPDLFLAECPSKEELESAANRIAGYVHQTPLVKSSSLSEIAGADLLFKMENLQKAGAFKSRGASNAVITLIEKGYQGAVATHSSGNHAQALSRVASRYGLISRIIMPEDSPEVKVNAVKGYGGLVNFCKPTLAAREETLKQIIEVHGGIEIHPYDNYSIIAGQASCAMEILETEDPDFIIAPVGGGGLLAGTALATHYFGKRTKVIAAEPENVNDASVSFGKGAIEHPPMRASIADGLRTYLGERNFPIIQRFAEDIITVKEHRIAEAMYLFWERTKYIIEPSSAVALAAVMDNPYRFGGKKTAIIISGGNVDLKKLPWSKIKED